MTTQDQPSAPLADILTEQEDRQLMAAVVLPNTGALTHEERTKVRTALRAYTKKHGLSELSVSKQTGLGHTTVYNAISGPLNKTDPAKIGKLDTHLRELNMWMEADARRRATRPDAPFVFTRVARRIINAAKGAIRNSTIAICIGPAGVGKTTVAHHLYETTTGAIYMRIGRREGNSPQLRRRLADLAKASTRHRLPKALKQLPVSERVYEKLRNSNRLLIIDEAHRLADDGLEYLRDLYDETNIPILLLCTLDLWQRIQADADEDHGQLFSRIGCVETIAGTDVDVDTTPGGGNSKLFTRAEIKQLFESPTVKLHPSAMEHLYQTANSTGHGSLRRCRLLLSWAIDYAQRKGGGVGSAVTLDGELLEAVEARRMRSRSGRQVVRDRRVIAATA